MYFDEVEFLRLSGGLFFTSRSRGIFLGERKGEDRGMTSQSVTLGRDDCLQDMVLSMEVCYILRKERHIPDSKSTISRVESPCPG